MIVFLQSGGIRAKWLCSGKSCSLRKKMVVFDLRGCTRRMWLYWESGCIRAKMDVFRQNGCNR